MDPLDATWSEIHGHFEKAEHETPFGLKVCLCEAAPPALRVDCLQLVCAIAAEQERPNRNAFQGLVIGSFGAGGLLQELMQIRVLLPQHKSLTFYVIDTEYKDAPIEAKIVRGQLQYKVPAEPTSAAQLFDTFVRGIADLPEAKTAEVCIVMLKHATQVAELGYDSCDIVFAMDSDNPLDASFGRDYSLEAESHCTLTGMFPRKSPQTPVPVSIAVWPDAVRVTLDKKAVPEESQALQVEIKNVFTKALEGKNPGALPKDVFQSLGPLLMPYKEYSTSAESGMAWCGGGKPACRDIFAGISFTTDLVSGTVERDSTAGDQSTSAGLRLITRVDKWDRVNDGRFGEYLERYDKSAQTTASPSATDDTREAQ